MTGKTVRALAFIGLGLAAPLLCWAQQRIDPGTLEQLQPQLTQIENPFGGQAYALIIGLVAIIVAALYFASQRERRKQELLWRFAEQDKPVPAGLLPAQPSRHRELRRATWLVALGLALGVVLYVPASDWRVAAWCLIPLFLGFASFANAALFYPESSAPTAVGNGD